MKDKFSLSFSLSLLHKIAIGDKQPFCVNKFAFTEDCKRDGSDVNKHHSSLLTKVKTSLFSHLSIILCLLHRRTKNYPWASYDKLNFGKSPIALWLSHCNTIWYSVKRMHKHVSCTGASRTHAYRWKFVCHRSIIFSTSQMTLRAFVPPRDK